METKFIRDYDRPEKRIFKLVSKRKETENVMSFFFEPEDKMFKFKPGHFVNISFKNDIDNLGNRSFSIANSPTEENLMLTIKKVGSFTTKIFEANIGEEFVVLGPLGLPYIKDESEKVDYVFIAGGSGIVPFRSILYYSKDTNFKNKIYLFYSNRTEEDIIYKEELKKLKEKMENFVLIETLTREEKEGYEKGRINSSMLKKYLDGFENKKYIICGPKGLVTGSIEMLKELNVDIKNIKTESWGN